MLVKDFVNELKTSVNVEEMISICKRVNNSKRDFLFVNSYQGKHIPMSPEKILETYEKLNKEMQRHLLNTKNRVFIAFAETATAIGCYLASENDGYFLTTTREELKGEDKTLEPFLVFEEEHSHAVSQLLYCKDLDVLRNAEEIIFIDDEISTGKTIFNFIKALEKKISFKDINYKVVSFLNWMTEDNKKMFNNYNINFIALASGCLKETNKKVDVNNIVEPEIISKENIVNETKYDFSYESFNFNFFRTGFEEHNYKVFAKEIAEKISVEIKKSDKKILVVGTEEFMYLPLLIASEIEKNTNTSVKFHATTRSPITISQDVSYKINNGNKFYSTNNNERINFIYNLEEYDLIYLIVENNLIENCFGNSDKPTIYQTLKKYSKNLNIVKI